VAFAGTHELHAAAGKAGAANDVRASVVLGVPPIDRPQQAVRAAVVAEIKRRT
jgi:hypothetical protein